MSSACSPDLRRLNCEGKLNSPSVVTGKQRLQLVVREEGTDPSVKQRRNEIETGTRACSHEKWGENRHCDVDSDPARVHIWWRCFHVEKGQHTAGTEQLMDTESQNPHSHRGVHVTSDRQSTSW